MGRDMGFGGHFSMARTLHRLSAVKVDATKTPGYYADGGGLYLRVAPGGTRAWIFRFTMGGKTRDGGLGSYPTVSLAKARAEAERCRQFVAAGVDPIEARKKEREAALAATEKVMTFRDCGAAVIASHEAGWRNAKHRQQWTNTLKTYVYPFIGDLPVATIDTALVVKVLEPLWRTKPETASRVRGRIETILDWARVRGYRESEMNPARWRGHLDQLLPSKQKVRHVRHHAALPYTQVPAFMSELRKREGIAERALEFGILTATRSSEFREAEWRDIDFEEKTWTARVKLTCCQPDRRVPSAAQRCGACGSGADAAHRSVRVSRPAQRQADQRQRHQNLCPARHGVWRQRLHHPRLSVVVSRLGC